MSALNPVFTVGDRLAESLVVHGAVARADAKTRASALLDAVRMPDAGARMADYPHQLSGGQRQRAVVAVAVACCRWILADEPTTALDVTVQSEVVAILPSKIRDRSLGMLFITHDLDLAAAINDTLAVMYAGAIVEPGSAAAVYNRPRHPYTGGSVGLAGPVWTRSDVSMRFPVDRCRPSKSPRVVSLHPAVRWSPRQCLVERPALQVVDDREVACHHVEATVDHPTGVPA